LEGFKPGTPPASGGRIQTHPIPLGNMWSIQGQTWQEAGSQHQIGVYSHSSDLPPLMR
jgi:hypothetical protein